MSTGLGQNTTEQMGALPAAPGHRSLDGPILDELRAYWRNQGVWLGLWSPSGTGIDLDDRAPRFWDRLVSQGRGFLQQISNLVCRSLTTPGETVVKFELGPWAPDVNLMAITLGPTRRPDDIVVAGFLGSAFDEAFSRLCDQCRLDRRAMEREARRSASRGSTDLQETARAIAFTIQQAYRAQVAERESQSLSHNLGNTYEELHLLYHISEQLALPEDPARMLHRVAEKVCEVSRASSVAFVLFDEAFALDSEHSGEASRRIAIEHRIAQAGTGSRKLAELHRLAESVGDLMDGRAEQLMLNNVAGCPAVAWASDWLKHLLVFPLRFEERRLGVMFALNCTDEGDFTSIDAHLLRTVSDRVAASLENQRLYGDLADLLMGLLHALVNSVDAKDPYTCGHSERVAYYSRELARHVGLSPERCQRVYLSGLLHDVGKIGVNDAILSKPGKLTHDEFDTLKRHPEIGARILAPIRQVQDILPGVLHHHERMDGKGYPARLLGSEIPELGRIICLADCFDAMTTNRTYRSAMSLPLVSCEIRRCSGTQFDPRLAEAFLQMDLRSLLDAALNGAAQFAESRAYGAMNNAARSAFVARRRQGR